MRISPARMAAFEVLLRIERDAAFSSVLLPQFEAELNEKDRGLCHQIVLGVLRRKLFLDRLIESLSGKRKIDTEVAIALRIGLFQLVYLDRVPAHSAINESVELVGRAKKSSAKSFANAILRSVNRERPVIGFKDEMERLSVEESHPRWLVERWTKQFGLERAAAICNANNQTPQIAFRPIKDIAAVLDHLEKSGTLRRSEFVPDCFVAEKLSTELRELARDNAIYFQDEGSQLVAQAVVDTTGMRILDVCAAPGGKTSMLAKTRNVIAGDLHFARLERLRQTCSAQAVDVSIVQLDAENVLPFGPKSFDTVFVDAPCSGTGTIRHNPELRYFIGENDINELSGKQLRILQNASELVADGGKLVYSTCSLECDENERVADAFTTALPSFRSELPNVPVHFHTGDGFARTYPDRDGTDGFFIAVFHRS